MKGKAANAGQMTGILAGTMQLNGDRTRPACRFRRLAENIVSPSFSTLFGEGQYGWTKCLAGRQTRQASGLRSPTQLHRSGLVPVKNP
jgi:hypothetical protein